MSTRMLLHYFLGTAVRGTGIISLPKMDINVIENKYDPNRGVTFLKLGKKAIYRVYETRSCDSCSVSRRFLQTMMYSKCISAISTKNDVFQMYFQFVSCIDYETKYFNIVIFYK
jgi:hypothetical protein